MSIQMLPNRPTTTMADLGLSPEVERNFQGSRWVADSMQKVFWMSAQLFVALLSCFETSPLLAVQSSPACKGPVELERAISTQPSAGAFNALGAYFAQRNQFSCAIPAFESALKLEPKSVETRYNLGLALMQKGDRSRAATELRKVVLEKPGLVNARNALGNVLLDLGDLGGAEQQFKEALKVDARPPSQLTVSVRLPWRRGDSMSAIGYFKQALAIEPDSFDDQLSLGVAYSQNSNFEEAVSVLKKLTQRAPSVRCGLLQPGNRLCPEPSLRRGWRSLRGSPEAGSTKRDHAAFSGQSACLAEPV